MLIFGQQCRSILMGTFISFIFSIQFEYSLLPRMQKRIANAARGRHYIFNNMHRTKRVYNIDEISIKWHIKTVLQIGEICDCHSWCKRLLLVLLVSSFYKLRTKQKTVQRNSFSQKLRLHIT